MANENEKAIRAVRKVLRFKDGMARVKVEHEIGRREILIAVHSMRIGSVKPTRGSVAGRMMELLHAHGYNLTDAADDIVNVEDDTATVTLAEYLFPEIVQTVEV